MSDTETHTGPIRTPKQLLLAVFFSFVIPIFAIIALVFYVVSETKPAGSTETERNVLGGVNAQDRDKGISERIQKVGSVEIRDANRPLKSGEEVFKAQCTTCHTAGVAGAPKFADAGAWSARIRTGFESLVKSALLGKGAMPAQGGGDFDDVEVARAVAYMANAAGAKFAEPQRSAVPVATAQAQVAAALPGAATLPATAPAATATPAQAAQPVAANGEALFKQACAACHLTGVANAPKFGDKAAWAPRLKQGMSQLVDSVLKGKGAMPPKGGTAASEPEIRAAVQYMVSAVK